MDKSVTPGKKESIDRVNTQFAHSGDESGIYKAWEDFLSGVSRMGPPVRVVVESSWKRSATRGVDAYGRRTPVVLGAEHFQRLLKRNRLLSSAATPTMHENAALLRGTRSILILTNSTGVVLEVVGDPATKERGCDINLSLGGSWNEADVGTNGIGTAIAIGKPIQVHASEHFCEGVKQWTCAAAPIWDPRDKTLLGVLDISGPDISFCQHNLALVMTAAHQIESVITERLLVKRSRLFEACLSKQPCSNGGMVLLDHHGVVVCINADASERIGRGEISAALGMGKRLIEPGNEFDVDELKRNLPPECHADWLHPVTDKRDTLGAMLLIPHRREHYLASHKPESDRPSPTMAERHSHDSETQVVEQSENGSTMMDESSKSKFQADTFSRIVRSSAVMEVPVARARRFARSLAPILIQGETGVGKELFASAIQAESTLADGPFVVCNCGALSEELIGSELFGYVKGAFTGASNEGRIGRFEEASGGTLCLDEIGELPPNLQPYLLRVLDEGMVYRIGENKPRKVQVRLLAMTNRNLLDEVAAGHFRRDLFHRISVTTVAVPPLRERGSDIDELIHHFVKLLSSQHQLQIPGIDRHLLKVLRSYHWPGNIRELRNVVESLLLTGSGERLTLDDLPQDFLEAAPAERERSGIVPVKELAANERQTIENAIKNSGGNLTRAAKKLGISRSTLYRKINFYELQAHS